MAKPIEELTFTDDFMFGRVMQNPEICKGLLERLLEIKIDKIEYPVLQKTISPHYKSKICGSWMSHHNKSGDILVKPKFAEFTRQGCQVNDFMWKIQIVFTILKFKMFLTKILQNELVTINL